MPEERLQKILAAAGVASRRASEALITAGRVRVNGRVASIGDQADGSTAQIEVDGMLVGVGAARTYVALHKPAGVTSTTRDRHAETTVLDLMPTALTPDGTRLYPVGRLDLDSEGLLLLTNDGTWADHVLHPRFGVQREYAVAVERPLDREQAALLKAGIPLDEGLATLMAPLRPATPIETRTLSELLHPPPHPDLIWYRAVIAQGWKRQLRRMFAVAGAPILRLVRVRIGTVRLDRLPTGRARLLRAPEIRQLGSVPGPGNPRRQAPQPSAMVPPGRRHPSADAVAPGAAAPGVAAPGVAAKGRPTTRQKGAPGSSGPRRPAPKPKALEGAPRAGNSDTPRASNSPRPGKGDTTPPGRGNTPRPPTRPRRPGPDRRARRPGEDYPPGR